MSKVALSSQLSAALSSGRTAGVKTQQEKGGSGTSSGHGQSEENAGFMAFVANYFQAAETKGEKAAVHAGQIPAEHNTTAGSGLKAAVPTEAGAHPGGTAATEGQAHQSGKEAKPVPAKQEVFPSVVCPVSVVVTAASQGASDKQPVQNNPVDAAVQKTQAAEGPSAKLHVPPAAEQNNANPLPHVAEQNNANPLPHDKNLPTQYQARNTAVPEQQNTSVSVPTISAGKNASAGAAKQSNLVAEPNLQTASVSSEGKNGQNSSGTAKNESVVPGNGAKSGHASVSVGSNFGATETKAVFAAGNAAQSFQSIPVAGSEVTPSVEAKNTVMTNAPGFSAATKNSKTAAFIDAPHPAPKAAAEAKPSYAASDATVVVPSAPKEVSSVSVPVSSQQNAPAEFMSGNSVFFMQLSQVRLLSNGTYNMSAVLTPPELGKVEAEVKLSNGIISVAITSHSPQTHNLLLQHGREIAETLQSDLGNVSFSLQQDKGQSFGGGKNQQSSPPPGGEQTPAQGEEMILHSLYLGANSLHVVL